MPPVRQILPLVTWLVTLVVAIVAFTALGSGPLAAPPVAHPSAWGDWVAAREPVVATVALLRLVVLALAWYLVGVTTVGAVARIARLTSLVRVADALSVPVVRRVLQTSLGVGLATAVVASSAGGIAVPRPGQPDPSGTPLMQPVDATGPDPPAMRPMAQATDEDDSTPSDPRMHALDDATMPPPTMRALGDAGPSGLPPPGMRPMPATGPPAGPAPVPNAPALPDDPARPDRPTHTVRTGDHLWRIAHDHLAGLGEDPSDQQVAEYWRRLIEVNRDRLVDPANPDFIVPGQEFVLPDVGAAR